MNYDNGTLEICTVDLCKCTCVYCPQKNLKKGYESLGHKASFSNITKLSWETFKTCINKVPKEVCIDFAGFVEPFHSALCSDMINYVHNKGHKIRLFSTLSECRIEDIEKIKHIPFVDCCLHLPDDKGLLHVEVTDNYINVVNYWIKNIRCSSHVFGNKHPKLSHINSEIKKLTEEHLINRGGQLNSTTQIQIKQEYKSGKIWCKSPFMMRNGPYGKLNFNVMDIFGNVYLCCCCFGLQHRLGNLLENSYEYLFQSEEYIKVINGLNGDESINILCRTCDMSVPQ